MKRQFETFKVCQVCGRATPSEDAQSKDSGWLVSPHKTDRNITIVRCPQHWSDHALRISKAGRTAEMRRRMQEALAMPAPPIPVGLSPFPIRERTPERK